MWHLHGEMMVSSHIGAFCHGASAPRNLHRRHNGVQATGGDTCTAPSGNVKHSDILPQRWSSAPLAALVGLRRLRIALNITAARFSNTGHALAICSARMCAKNRHIWISARLAH